MHTFGHKMNGNQIIRPDIKPPDNGSHPVLGKLRRKLGLTYVLSNPFKVPVAQAPVRPPAPEDESVRKSNQESI
ncbi:MAG: hypothetical protein ACLP7I_19260 [Limisphaerales bacterium]